MLPGGRGVVVVVVVNGMSPVKSIGGSQPQTICFAIRTLLYYAGQPFYLSGDPGLTNLGYN